MNTITIICIYFNHLTSLKNQQIKYYIQLAKSKFSNYIPKRLHLFSVKAKKNNSGVLIEEHIKENVMGQAQKIHFQGHHYQVDIVKKMLIEEISLYERRLVLLKRASLSGQDKLVKTYQDMIDARTSILDELKGMKNT